MEGPIHVFSVFENKSFIKNTHLPREIRLMCPIDRVYIIEL